MYINCVTFTGADDSIKPSDLINISEKYPFVEFAILFSQTNSGVERYPSLNWIEELVNQIIPNNKINLSAHLCGKWCENAISGDFSLLSEENYYKAFKRIQLNMGKDRLEQAIRSDGIINFAMDEVNRSIIFGGNYKNSPVNGAFFENSGIFPLFDESGGRGIKSKEWPRPFLKGDGTPIYCGYAGGLGPDNVLEEVQKIANVVGDGIIWIDMETNIRTGNKFDLEKCEKVLEFLTPWLN